MANNFRIRNLRTSQVQQNVRSAVGRALFMGASHILNESTRIAPLDEGPLTQTAGVDVDATNGQASIYYVQKYAVKLHEDPRINIRRGRQMKYLEKPMLAESDTVQRMMADELRRAFGG